MGFDVLSIIYARCFWIFLCSQAKFALGADLQDSITILVYFFEVVDMLHTYFASSSGIKTYFSPSTSISSML